MGLELYLEGQIGCLTQNGWKLLNTTYQNGILYANYTKGDHGLHIELGDAEDLITE